MEKTKNKKSRIRVGLVSLLAVTALACVSIISLLPKQNQDIKESAVLSIDKETGTITGFASEDTVDKNIVIPSEIDGAIVRNIGDRAFKDQGIESVVFPETLESIGFEAFAGNALTEVSFPENLNWIDDLAFSHNFLRDIDFNDNLERIGAFAFQFNELQDLMFPKNIVLVEEWAFFGNDIREMNIPPVTHYQPGEVKYSDEEIDLGDCIITDFTGFGHDEGSAESSGK